MSKDTKKKTKVKSKKGSSDSDEEAEHYNLENLYIRADSERDKDWKKRSIQ